MFAKNKKSNKQRYKNSKLNRVTSWQAKVKQKTSNGKK